MDTPNSSLLAEFNSMAIYQDDADDVEKELPNLRIDQRSSLTGKKPSSQWLPRSLAVVGLVLIFFIWILSNLRAGLLIGPPRKVLVIASYSEAKYHLGLESR